jgi:lipopolysaccharide export system permease protein
MVGMKRLHRMIIRAFLGPLALTFLIVLFILVMQFLWKYVDDLMGKGLEWYVLMELLAYATASFVPLALPLAVLLSSIMTMGGLGENSELVPMRSAGLGLFRILGPLAVFVTVLSAASLVFSNNMLPVANLKFRSLLWDITEKKPALNLRPGTFYNGIDGFSIRVMDKDEETGVLSDVLIYDHRAAFQGNRTVIRARSGTMQRSTNGQYLVLNLKDGHFYDEHGVAGGTKGSAPMMRGTFAEDEVRLDLSGLGLRRTDEDLFKDHYKMLTMAQLDHGEDSLMQHMDERSIEHRKQLQGSIYILRGTAFQKGPQPVMTKQDSSGSPPSVEAWSSMYEVAMNMARNQVNHLQQQIDERHGRAEQLARYRIEWHRKPMLAAACLLFFFIGAPLGAIIRKGGMGLPTVFAIMFFLVFHIVSFSMEKLAIAGGIQPWLGMWLASFVLLPIGLFLTWKAATDSPLFDADVYYRGWQRFRALFKRDHAHSSAVQ